MLSGELWLIEGGDGLPSHKVHCYVDRQIYGKSYWKIHVTMDEPVFILGWKHRVLFHDWISAWAIAEECYPGDSNAVLAALNHIYIDESCSADPVFKADLERLAEIDAIERARARRNKRREKRKKAKKRCRGCSKRGKKHSPDSIEGAMEFFRKLEAARDLDLEFHK
jgi:hypothetical protein